MNRIEEYRKKVRLTQQQAAEAAGWKYQSRWSGYERGDRAPSVADAQTIVKTLNSFGADCTLDTVFPADESGEEAA